MKKTLTVQLSAIIIGIMIAMLAITSVATYKTAYDKLYDAAGVEAFGCANITTGLINPGDVVKIIDGDIETTNAVGKQLNWTTAHKDIFETQYIVDLEGKILALDDNFKEKGVKPGDIVPIDQEAIDELIETRHPTYSKLFKFAGLERLSGYAPIFDNHDASGEIIAISVIDFDGTIVGDRTWDVVRNGILISLIPMLLASLFTIYLIRRKTGQISALIAHAKEIADGNLAINDIEVKSKDEVGELASTLNTMTANLHDMIATMKSTANQLSENSVGTATSLYEMQTAIQQVAENMSEVTISISNGTMSADHASEILNSLANDIQNTKETADKSVANSKTTMTTAEEGQQRAKEINLDMEKIRTSSLGTSNTIQDLIESTTKIQDITTSIAGIAAQTNLLALNASIEAARAGEHGQGFAVVAEEVRKLAEQSNKEVAEVEKLIQDITNRIQQVVETTAESTALIEVGSGTVNLTAQSLSNISIAVSNTVDEIGKISELTATEANDSKQVVDLISQLTEVIHSIEDMTTSVSAATEETSASIDEVTNRSIETSEMAKELEKVVSRFKL